MSTQIKRLAYSVEEFAGMTGVPSRTVRHWAQTNVIRAHRLGGRVLIAAAEVERLLGPATSA